VSPAGNQPRIVLIGGGENKDGDLLILSEVASLARPGALVLATMASGEPLRQWEIYSRVFKELGVTEVRHLAMDSREDAADPKRAAVLNGASCLFFTGGDQLKITSKLGGTALYAAIRAAHHGGELSLSGTSAGASAMGETMLVSAGNEQEESHKVKGAFLMARGLGLVRDMVIDQHFAQRARIERLVGAIAENPGVLGIGIDEDTAVILDGSDSMRIIGSGAVYVADGNAVTYSNVSENASERTLCLFDVRLHVLAHGTAFNVITRRPRGMETQEA
jgi:cyanophycinase